MPVLPAQVDLDERLPRRLRQDGNGRDVFALVKMNMSDDVLSQKPLLVWPETFMSETEAFFSRLNHTREVVQQSMDEERVAELSRLADNLEKDFPHLRRGVQYYRTLLTEGRDRKPYSPLKFIDAGPSAGERYTNLQMGPRPLPPRPRLLQVVFHH